MWLANKLLGPATTETSRFVWKESGLRKMNAEITFNESSHPTQIHPN